MDARGGVDIDRLIGVPPRMASRAGELRVMLENVAVAWELAEREAGGGAITTSAGCRVLASGKWVLATAVSRGDWSGMRRAVSMGAAPPLNLRPMASANGSGASAGAAETAVRDRSGAKKSIMGAENGRAQGDVGLEALGAGSRQVGPRVDSVAIKWSNMSRPTRRHTVTCSLHCYVSRVTALSGLPPPSAPATRLSNTLSTIPNSNASSAARCVSRLLYDATSAYHS